MNNKKTFSDSFSYLKKILTTQFKELDPSYEYEIRIGTKTKKGFVPGITKEQYNLLIEYLSDYPKSTSNTLVNYYDNNIREVIEENPDTESQTRLETKKCISRFDCYFDALTVRIAQSREIEVPSEDRLGSILYTRRKYRTIYKLKGFEIHLTNVNDLSYEIEIEFTLPAVHKTVPVKGYDLSIVEDIIKMLL